MSRSKKKNLVNLFKKLHASLVLHIVSEKRITCRGGGWVIQEQFTIKSHTNGLNEEGNVASVLQQQIVFIYNK